MDQSNFSASLSIQKHADLVSSCTFQNLPMIFSLTNRGGPPYINFNLPKLGEVMWWICPPGFPQANGTNPTGVSELWDRPWCVLDKCGGIYWYWPRLWGAVRFFLGSILLMVVSNMFYFHVLQVHQIGQDWNQAFFRMNERTSSNLADFKREVNFSHLPTNYHFRGIHYIHYPPTEIHFGAPQRLGLRCRKCCEMRWASMWSGVSGNIFRSMPPRYCWWFRNPANQLIWQISHYLQGWTYIPGGCLGFLNHQQYCS